MGGILGRWTPRVLKMIYWGIDWENDTTRTTSAPTDE